MLAVAVRVRPVLRAGQEPVAVPGSHVVPFPRPQTVSEPVPARARLQTRLRHHADRIRDVLEEPARGAARARLRRRVQRRPQLRVGLGRARDHALAQ